MILILTQGDSHERREGFDAEGQEGRGARQIALVLDGVDRKTIHRYNAEGVSGLPARRIHPVC